MEKLYTSALKAYKNSYSPYSNFAVGAAVLLNNGKIISGANIENASYGLCMCAERVALYTTYANGYCKDDILKLLVVANTTKPVTPCGACRQVMIELMNSDCEIIMSNLNKDIMILKVMELLPYSFSDEDLK